MWRWRGLGRGRGKGVTGGERDGEIAGSDREGDEGRGEGGSVGDR